MRTRDDELRPYLSLIGELAVDSARLEWGLVGLYAILRPETGFSEGFAVPHDRLVRGIKQAIKSHQSWEIAFGHELLYWVKEASVLLRQRGEIMHSSWIVGTDSTTDAPGVYRTHHKTQAQTMHGLQDLDALVERQHAHMSTYPATWTMAHLMVSSAEPQEGDGASGLGQEEPPTR